MLPSKNSFQLMIQLFNLKMFLLNIRSRDMFSSAVYFAVLRKKMAQFVACDFQSYISASATSSKIQHLSTFKRAKLLLIAIINFEPLKQSMKNAYLGKI